MPQFSDIPYFTLDDYFEETHSEVTTYTGAVTGGDVSLVGDRHSIFVRGGYWTRLYVDIDGTLTEVKFRSNPSEWVANRSFIFTKDPSGADFSNGSDVYFRKDSYLHDYFRTLAETDDRYKHFVNLQKTFIYLGKIFLTDSSTREYRIKHYGMRDFVVYALPEHNRTDRLIEYLDLYYDRVHSEIYSMLKNMITMIDPYEVDIEFLDYITDMYGVTISESLSADVWQLTESEEREFVARIIWWLKRKGTYAALYIIWKLIVGRTDNLLNIYERWHDGATPGPPSFASFIDYLYISYYGYNTGRNLVKNGNMEVDDCWDDYNSPEFNVRSELQFYNGDFSRFFGSPATNAGIQSDGFTTELNKEYKCTARVWPVNWGAAKIAMTDGNGLTELISTIDYNLNLKEWNLIEVSGVQTSPGDNTTVTISSYDELVTGDNMDFDTVGDWVAGGNTTISSVGGGNPNNCLKLERSIPTTGSVSANLDPLPIILQTGDTIYLSFDVKTDGVWNDQIRVSFNGDQVLLKDYYAPSGSNWGNISDTITSTIPDNMDNISIIGLNLPSASYFCVDNFSVRGKSDNYMFFVDNVRVHEYSGAGQYYYESKGASAYPTEYDGYGDNWTLSPHYKVEIDMTNEPFGNDYIINRSILYNLHKFWESIRPVRRVSHYRELIAPTADWTGQWNTLYKDEYEAEFKTICMNPPLEPAVGTDFYSQRVASSLWEASHSLNSNNVIVQVYDNSRERIIAEEIYPSGTDYMLVDLYSPKTGTAYMALSTSTVQQATPSATWDINHGQGDDIITYFTDSNRYRIYPETVYITDTNNLQATFSTAESGYCMTRVKDVRYNQTTPEYVWNVQHDLGVVGTICNFYRSDGEKIYPDIVKQETEDLILATFSEPITGYAVINSIAEPQTSDSLWTPLTSGYIKLGNGFEPETWNPWSANDLKSPIWTIANEFIDYVETSDNYYVTFELPLSSYEGNITEVGLFNVDNELIFYSYCDPLYKIAEFGLTMHYRLEKN